MPTNFGIKTKHCFKFDSARSGARLAKEHHFIDAERTLFMLSPSKTVNDVRRRAMQIFVESVYNVIFALLKLVKSIQKGTRHGSSFTTLSTAVLRRMTIGVLSSFFSKCI